jgi:uncharacterized protein YecT (DUF1311 family)
MKTMLFIFLFFIPALFFAQEPVKKVHPIDKWLDDCMGKMENQSTAGMIECAENAYVKWDKELNKIYKELMNNLKPEGQKSLKESQKSWLKVRDEEFKLLTNIYSEKQGTMYGPIHIMDKVEIVKQRTLELQNLLDTVTDKRFGE